MTHASNVLGTVQPIETIAPIVRAAGALFLVDAAQSAGVVPIDLDATPIDLLAFPGTRPSTVPPARVPFTSDLGPTARSAPGARGEPAAIRRARPSHCSMPYLLEGGTPNVLGAAGLAAGIGWVMERGPDNLRSPRGQPAPAGRGLGRADRGWRIAGRWDPATHVGALSLIVPEGLTPQDLGSILDVSFEIAVRPGLHCAPYIHRALGTFPDGTLRLSPGPFTTAEQIDRFLRGPDRDHRGRPVNGGRSSNFSTHRPRGLTTS